MHKERTSNVGLSEKFVFDAEDIAFIENEGALLNKTQLAKHFKVSFDAIDNAMKRQPEMFQAYENAKLKQKNMHKERVSGAGYNAERYVFDESDIKKIEELAASLSVSQIADYFKIGITTLYDVFKRQPLVAESYKRGKAVAIQRMADNLQEHAIHGGSGNMTAAIFYLKTQGRWSEAVPEAQIEEEIVKTPEEKEAYDKEVKLYTEFKNDREAFTQWKKETNK